MTPVRTLISSLSIALVMLYGTGVAKAQLISANPQALSFVYQIGGSNPGGQNVYLTCMSTSLVIHRRVLSSPSLELPG
ncbi:exported hypothetical protein [Candidatus Sulfopaludibacter sp. SbA3]|nr:exported hypothetical protein [Candidatus Sulfopaludibacter sp. SbA3]